MPSENISIKVVGKCRPLTQEESDTGGNSVVTASGDKVKVNCAGKDSSFSLDGSFGPEDSNRKLYDEKVNPMLQRALDGYNVSVLAFGVTGGGKSHVMTGSEADPGIVPLLTQNLFRQVGEKNSREYMITVSHVEIMDDKMTDLLNPHSNNMTIRQHPYKGIFVDGLSEFVVRTGEEIAQYYDQGNRARKLGASDIKAHRTRAAAIFTILVEQKERQSSKVGLSAKITLADLAGCEGNNSDQGNQVLLKVISTLGEGKNKGSHVPYRDSKLSRLLQDSFGGNSATLVIAALSPLDKSYQDTMTCLQYSAMMKGIKNHVKLNVDDTQDVIGEMRQDIANLRNKIASSSQPDRDDVDKMEDLVKSLEVAKKQTWAEKERTSAKLEEERKISLANKGILEWVMDSMKKGNREVKEKLVLLQKERDQLTNKYKEKRSSVESLKDELQKRIADYAKFTESGKKSESETKSKVSGIHELKERLKKEAENLKEIKDQLHAVQAKQQQERENAKSQTDALKGSLELRQKIEREERGRLEQEHKTQIAEELERCKLEADSDKTEIQLRMAEGKEYSSKEGADLEAQVAEMRSEKSVVALKLQCLEMEKQRTVSELEDVYKSHKEELELQQLQHYQTFRQYREVFEEQKAAIDQRYRQLLEESIQDAVYLASRNNDLTEENKALKQELAEMKDVVTKLGGQMPSSS